jgi:hypothetical protein
MQILGNLAFIFMKHRHEVMAQQAFAIFPEAR